MLGVTLDNLFISSVFAAAIIHTLRSKNKVLKVRVNIWQYLQEVTEIHNFFTVRDLLLSQAKCTATVFTTCTKEVNIVDGDQIPPVKHLKMLEKL